MRTNPNDMVYTDKILRSENHHTQKYDIHSAGLTKRERFAGIALQGILADGMFQADSSEISEKTKLAARTAVQAADALIVELNRGLK